MRYIYNKEGNVLFVQTNKSIYDEEGQLLKNVRIKDGDVYSGTEYVGYIIQDTFYSSEDFQKNGIRKLENF